MIFLYACVLTLFGLLRLVVAARAGRLEKRFAKAALAVEKVAREPAPKAGNGHGRADLYRSAKQQYLLGQLVQRRDALEAKYEGWQGRADRLGRWVAAVRGLKGRTLPYTAGVLDVWLALAALDALGVADVLSAKQVIRWVSECLIHG